MEKQLLSPDELNIRATGIPPGMEGEVSSEQVPASPEEENQYQQAETKMMRLVHGRETRDHVIDILNDRDVPVQQAVGRAASQIIGTIHDQAKAAKVELSSDLLMNLGLETVKELLDVGIAGGFFPLKEGTPEYEQVLKMAMLEGVKAHGEKVLASPDGKKLSDDAQNHWANEVAKEVDAGTADPEYLQMARGGQAQPAERQLLEAPA
jgi:hypothetical protein